MHITASAFGAGEATAADLRETWRTARMGGEPLQNATDVDEGAVRIRKHAEPREAEYDAALNDFIDETVSTALFHKSDDTDDAIRMAGRIRSYPGIARLMRLLDALGKKRLSRWNRQKRNEVTKAPVLLRQLIRYSMPGYGETWEQFDSIVKQALKEKRLDEQRLLELALAAPQWAQWIGRSMSRTGLLEAVEWLLHQAGEDWIYTPALFVWHNFNRGGSDSFPTMEQIAESPDEAYKPWLKLRSNHSDVDLESDACVDTQWFERASRKISAAHWLELEACLPAIATPQRVTQIRTITEALRGDTDRQTLRKRIETEMNGIDVQALSLIPVAIGDQRESDLAERMRILQEHRRAANRLKASKRDQAISANQQARATLALRAGMDDPERLEWFAMIDIQDRIDAVSPVEIDDTLMKLVVQANGKPIIEVTKSGKSQKSIPAKLGKKPEVQKLKKLQKELQTQSRQVVRSLEQAMVTGATFDAAELQRLLQNGLIGTPLRSLLLMHGQQIGLPRWDDDCLVLVDVDGTQFPMNSDLQFRIAHVSDLAHAGSLKAWRDAFADRVQAIRQVDRELFQPTTAELASQKPSITRFADYPLREDQTHAILLKMNWRSDRYETPYTYAQHHPRSGVTSVAELDFPPGDGDRVCIKEVWFADPQEAALFLKDVDRRVMSETIRQINQIATSAESD
ncbi:hypothetical protein Enr13x_19330 [Stieleria neptunia]|uniref:DUF4132 domain-containing protein n=1 Tax=Stieleria neptunia TaxID=2527979 RepID=A0A518HMP0_9BACT|nr:DUF4132 domain-containing protein [Stieleria neptunia]QDV42090.1 hypothetical protein Enr13x_19330 [Stieleria neptunia]